MIIEKVVDRFMDENTYIIGDEKTKKCTKDLKTKTELLEEIAKNI